MLDAIRTMFAYSAWANARVLAVAERLTPEQFLAASDGSDSIRDTLVHIAAAQWVWLERWQGRNPRALWDPAEFPDATTLRARWAAVAAATADYIAGLQESDLERPVSYVNFQGETWTYSLWQQMLDEVNHDTQHRSEAALMLTRLGHSPGWLDLLVYLDEQAAADAESGHGG